MFWGLYGPNSTLQHATHAAEHRSTQGEAKSKKEETDEALAQYTLWLMVFTGILALATIGLGVATFFLYLTGEKQIRNNAEVAAAQSRDMKETIDLSRAGIVSSHRPRLRIRNVVVKPYNPALVERMGFFQPNRPVSGQFYVVNVGGTRATITESHCVAVWSESGLPMRRPYEGENGNMSVLPVRLEPGQSIPGTFCSVELMTDRSNTIGTKIVRGLHLYVMGWVEYIDDNQIQRRTSFCREYEKREAFGEGRFYAVNDPDYEHEE